MSFVALVVALALEQWQALGVRLGLESLYRQYLRTLEQNFNGGTRRHGVVAALLAVAPPVVAVALVYGLLAAVHPLLALVVDIVVLYFIMGFRRFSHALSDVVAALKAHDVPGARRALAAWQGGSTFDWSSEDIARASIERGLVDAYAQVFGAIFWFVVLPGPIGAVLYRAAALAADEWAAPRASADVGPLVRDRAAFGAPARRFLAVLDWIPVRLTALSFAVVGDFEDAVACWRTQPVLWANEAGGTTAGILLAAGGGALGVQLGGPLPGPTGEREFRPEMGMGDVVEPELLPSAIGLVWRALVLWLGVILLATVANLAP
ncbi:MAG: CobD/CbiB family protein [Proteobacteria bacterium]|nr:CobD/CbiB family protein [Pseudomonadota bacterium]